SREHLPRGRSWVTSGCRARCGRRVRVSVSSEGGETFTTPTRHLLPRALVIAALQAHAGHAAAAGTECLTAWRTAAAAPRLGNLPVPCRDGDPTCDGDGLADGTCRVRAAVCLNVPGCAPGTIGPAVLRGAAGAAVAAQAAALPYPVAGT